MLSKTAWISLVSGLVLFASGCGGESGGSGSFYVETCSLGCSNGLGGNQVSCGVVNAAENQDLALLFSGAVDLGSVTKQSFQIFDVVSGAVPAGSFLIDPLNRNRLIFRPKLAFDVDGNPIFGFKKDASYKIFLAGTAQGDTGPFVESTGGRENQARVLCTITTSGIVDPIPGKPEVRIFVDQEDPDTGELTTVEILQGEIPGAIDIASASLITMVFDELMNIGTLIVPATGQSPFISVAMDTDGDLNTIVDRSTIDGSYSFSIDVSAQTTTLQFEAQKGFPGAGADPANPRLVVIDVPAAVTDIAGNGLGNAGFFNFAPVTVEYPPRTLPEGGEDFTTEANRDPRRSGALWDTAQGQLAPGQGGGSGRLGDLVVKGGETRSLATGPTRSSGTAEFLANPSNNDIFQVAGTIFTFKTNPTLSTDVKVQSTLQFTLSTLVDRLTAYADANPGSGPAKCSFLQANATTLLVTAEDPGPAGNSLTLSVSPPGLAALSGATLAGGGDGATFPGPGIITNFDFAAQPGAQPPPILVEDGAFEFSSVDVEPGASVALVGDSPARLLVRGDLRLQAGGTLDASGQDRGAHTSVTPYGQPGGRGGPGAAAGGRGGDRANITDLDLQASGAVAVASSVLFGSPGGGVGGTPPAGPGNGAGRGGVQWPTLFPVNIATYNDVAVDPSCFSHQVGGAGSGGAYATSGARGVARTDLLDGVNKDNVTVCNLPSAGPPCPSFSLTASGSAADVGLEPPSADPTAERLLTPAQGYLRGGAGGGGGGSHLTGTSTFGFPGCFGLGFFQFVDNSSAAGGGGGGALQVQVGDDAEIAGVIDAAGGTGGSASTDVALGDQATPGGGGSGGAILIEAGQLALDTANAGRLIVAGGAGGAGITDSAGGAGGTGLVRVEQAGGGLDAATIALAVEPTDTNDPTSQGWLSVGEWAYDPDPGVTTVEEGFSGAQSCWLVVPDDAFSLTFPADPDAPAAPADMSWNMDVILDLGNPGDPQPYPFRGTDGQGPYGGLYPQEAWGQLLNRDLLPGEQPAPVVVRFQGAKRTAPIADLCNVDLTSPLGGVQSGSLTPWVPAPTDLNSFFPLTDMVRWVIVFDRTAPFADQVLGVTNLRIEVQPE